MGGEGGADRAAEPILHVAPAGSWSKTEKGRVDGTGPVLVDPKTAHEGAGDTGYAAYLPETCGLCAAQDLAAQETERDAEI